MRLTRKSREESAKRNNVKGQRRNKTVLEVTSALLLVLVEAQVELLERHCSISQPGTWGQGTRGRKLVLLLPASMRLIDYPVTAQQAVVDPVVICTCRSPSAAASLTVTYFGTSVIPGSDM